MTTPAADPVTDALQVVVFCLADELFATPIEAVREILKAPIVTPVPNSPDGIDGVINVRGKIVPILNVTSIMHLEFDSTSSMEYVILLETSKAGIVGVQVRDVVEVMRITEADIKPAPKLVKSRLSPDLIRGVVLANNTRDTEQMVLVIDLDAVISESVTAFTQEKSSATTSAAPNRKGIK
jgi:purine-binding chemotaxis protein CheW